MGKRVANGAERRKVIHVVVSRIVVDMVDNNKRQLTNAATITAQEQQLFQNALRYVFTNFGHSRFFHGCHRTPLVVMASSKSGLAVTPSDNARFYFKPQSQPCQSLMLPKLCS